MANSKTGSFVYYTTKILQENSIYTLKNGAYSMSTTEIRRWHLSVFFKPSEDSCGDTLLLKLHLCKGQEEKTIITCISGIKHLCNSVLLMRLSLSCLSLTIRSLVFIISILIVIINVDLIRIGLFGKLSQLTARGVTPVQMQRITVMCLHDHLLNMNFTFIKKRKKGNKPDEENLLFWLGFVQLGLCSKLLCFLLQHLHVINSHLAWSKI